MQKSNSLLKINSEKTSQDNRSNATAALNTVKRNNQTFSPSREPEVKILP